MSDKAPRTIVKEVDYAVLYSDGTILIKNIRASYPHFDKPFKGDDDDGKGKYGIVGLMPKTPDRKAAKDLIKGEIDRILSEQKVVLPADRKFLRDGNLRPDKPEWVGSYTVSANETRQPALRHRVKDPKTGRAKILTSEEAAKVFYAGCYVNILIRPWWQNHVKWGKRVNANLVAAQFAGDGEPISEGRINDDQIDESFGAIDDDDSGYDDAASLGEELDL